MNIDNLDNDKYRGADGYTNWTLFFDDLEAEYAEEKAQRAIQAANWEAAANAYYANRNREFAMQSNKTIFKEQFKTQLKYAEAAMCCVFVMGMLPTAGMLLKSNLTLATVLFLISVVVTVAMPLIYTFIQYKKEIAKKNTILTENPQYNMPVAYDINNNLPVATDHILTDTSIHPYMVGDIELEDMIGVDKYASMSKWRTIQANTIRLLKLGKGN